MSQKYILVLFCLAAVLSLSGCNKLMEIYGIRKPASSSAQSPAMLSELPKVTDEGLAKVLLKPDRKNVHIVRDPFKPLIVKKTNITKSEDGKKEDGKKEEVKVDIDLLGIVRLEVNYTALLKSKTQKGVFKVGDTIDLFTIKEILNDRVILNNGDRDFTLERKKTAGQQGSLPEKK